jgi:hypothetical protein
MNQRAWSGIVHQARSTSAVEGWPAGGASCTRGKVWQPLQTQGQRRGREVGREALHETEQGAGGRVGRASCVR